MGYWIECMGSILWTQATYFSGLLPCKPFKISDTNKTL